MAKCHKCKDDVHVNRNSIRVIKNGVTKYFCSKKCFLGKK